MPLWAIIICNTQSSSKLPNKPPLIPSTPLHHIRPLHLPQQPHKAIKSTKLQSTLPPVKLFSSNPLAGRSSNPALTHLSEPKSKSYCDPTQIIQKQHNITHYFKPKGDPSRKQPIVTQDPTTRNNMPSSAFKGAQQTPLSVTQTKLTLQRKIPESNTPPTTCTLRSLPQQNKMVAADPPEQPHPLPR
jgi:hypothetical protein